MSRIRTDPGIGTETRLIRLVARLDPMKDHLTFLNAAVEFLKSGDGLRILAAMVKFKVKGN